LSNLKIPIRTCISCREKKEKKLLNRYQCIDKSLSLFSGNGRSFYLCNDCIENKKKCEKALFRQCRNKSNYFEQLKNLVE